MLTFQNSSMWVALVPIFNEIELFGMILKQEIIDLKSEMSEHRTVLPRPLNGCNSFCYLGVKV